MLQSIKQLYGNKLGALDGEIGHVNDFYFDDQNWAIRYVVADTGSWIPGRMVLLAPHAFGSFVHNGELLLANLTRAQIDSAPSTELHKPVSRQYEEDYYQYYGWPYYWEGDALWGMSPFPALGVPPVPLIPRPAATEPEAELPDVHLRSTKAICDYHIEALDGPVGHVIDFLMEARTWSIPQLGIKTGHWLSGSEVQIPTNKIDRISYESSTVYVKMTKEEVEKSPSIDLTPAVED